MTIVHRAGLAGVAVAVALSGALIMGMMSAITSGGGTAQAATGCGPTGVPTGTGSISWPLPAGTYRISSPYGPRGGTGASPAEFHHGVDLAAPLNTPILAAADGVIEKAGPASGFGDWIVEKSTVNGQLVGFVYGHEYPQGLLVPEGATVKAGQQIGLVGENGEATGPHVHFEVWPGGRLEGGHDVDPIPWLTGTTVTPTAPAAPTAAPPSAGGSQLTGPIPPQGQQATMSIDASQRGNVATITGVVKGRGLPLRAAVIAVATAMQESNLRNINYGDRDSLGLFQQRPSAGWGTPAQILDPVYATGKFLDGLVKVPNWAGLALSVAAQTVQVSAFPDAYAKWETQAEQLVAAAAGVDPIGVGGTCATA